jgi:outer membrane protein
MKRLQSTGLVIFLTGLITWPSPCPARETSEWSLDSCLSYALEENIEIRKSDLGTKRNSLYLEQSKAAMMPNLSASINQNFSWNYTYVNESGTSATGQATGSTSYGLNSSMDMFRGLKLKNQVEQSRLYLLSSQYSSETIRESVELNVLNAFLSVLYAREGVVNAENQIEVTGEQLALAEERLHLGIISQSDYLQIKSELASEKQTLVDARNDLEMARISLMQLMEYPVNSDFRVASPDLEAILEEVESPDAAEIYLEALDIKPQIKQAATNTESARLDEDIARADLMPSLSLNAGLGTNFTGLQTNVSYFDQLADNFSPRVGLSLSIPIFQKKQARTSIGVARIGIAEAELNEIDTRNSLRKEIEQAVASVISARQQYLASIEEYAVTQESVEVATEKLNQGLMNSVDYLYERNNLILSQSRLLQSKYKLIFSKKVLDFYRGVPITL